MNTPTMPPEAILHAQARTYRRLLGQYINELRCRLKMSQQKLAEEAGFSRTEIHNIEHGLTDEKVGTMYCVCRALHLPYGEVVQHTDYLMDHAEHRPPAGRLKSRRGKKAKRPLH